MKLVGFEQGSVTVQLDASECRALADALTRAHDTHRTGFASHLPLSDAFRVCARVASAQSCRALTLHVRHQPPALSRQDRSIVSVD